MSATTAPAETESPFLRALATRDPELAPTAATPDPPPAAGHAPDEATPDPAPTAGRDERGRFAPQADAAPPDEATPPDDTPAPDSATTAEVKPQDAVLPTLPAPDPRDQRIAEYERREASYQGNLNQARQQAAEEARQHAEAAGQQQARQAVVTELQRMVQSGEVSLEQAQAAYARQREGWQAEDLAAKEQGLAQREATSQMQALGGYAQEMTGRLWERATPLMAQTHGLPVEEVRAFWSDEKERERYQRAALQTRLAQERPDLAANASALEDYLSSADAMFGHLARATKSHTAQLAAKDAEIARLTLQLNRADAGDSPAARPESHARGGGAARDERAIAKQGGYEAVLNARDNLAANR